MPSSETALLTPALCESPQGRPLRVMFIITCMPVGGAETLLVNLVRSLDRTQFAPELCCLKYLGPLGEVLAQEIPAHTGLISNKYDVTVWWRLTRLLLRRKIDAVVTVGTGGDKMFWGRLAAKAAGVPVILSALHSTGLPDHVEFPNRLLAPITDGFIGVAASHGEYLTRAEGCPKRKVFVIPNGVDTKRFCPVRPTAEFRASLGIPEGAPVVSILAALRPEKNHPLFLQAAARIVRELPETHFLVIGNGALLEDLKRQAAELKLADCTHFLGTRHDVPELLAVTHVVLLTSHMEANPVSILEALACERPVVATRVGSVPETVRPGETGFLASAGDAVALADFTLTLLKDQPLARRLGQAGRKLVVDRFSLKAMVCGYQDLMTSIYERKQGRGRRPAKQPATELLAQQDTWRLPLRPTATQTGLSDLPVVNPAGGPMSEDNLAAHDVPVSLA